MSNGKGIRGRAYLTNDPQLELFNLDNISFIIQVFFFVLFLLTVRDRSLQKHILSSAQCSLPDKKSA